MKVMDIRQCASEISFRQLKLFEAVGRLASVRRGSEECNLSQPAVTQAISKLEQQLGEVLLERRSSGSYLTDAGKVFHLRVQRLFDQMADALVVLGAATSLQVARSMVNRISRSQARSLIALVETGSFAAAAETLGLAQASLQRAARDLEGNLRRAIFHRAASGILVSPEGIELGHKLKLATQEIEWGIREIQETRGSHASQIVLGALPFGGTLLLATVLDEFVARHPHTEVRIVSEGASEMRRRLRVGDVDILLGIVADSSERDLVNESLAKTPYEIVARPGHPLFSIPRLTRDDLARYEWIVGSEGSSRRNCFDLLFADGPVPRASITTSSLPIIHEMLGCSDRLTVMTSYEINRDSGSLMPLPFGPLDPSPSIGMTTRTGWLPTRLHKDFMNLLRERGAGWREPMAPMRLVAAR